MKDDDPVAQEGRSAEWRTHGERGRPQNHPQGAEIEARESASRSVSARDAGSNPAGINPSKEAVELAQKVEDCFGGLAMIVRPAERGLWAKALLPLISDFEQRTRLETLERAAKLTCGPCARKLYDRVADGKAGSL